MTNLDSILKSRDIPLSTKFRLVKAMVFPVVSAFSTVAAKVGAQYGVCYVISWGNTYEDYRHTQLAAGCTGDAGKAADLFAKITLEEAIVVETEPETVEVVEDAAAAPQTFDAGIVAAVAAIVSAAGYAISKKH